MLQVSIQIQGDKKTIARLKRAGVNITDFSEELRAVGEYLRDFVGRLVFETEGGILGARWAPLSEPYGFRKRTEYPGRGILERTGRLRRSFLFKSTATMVLLYNPTPYLKKHQFGIGVPRRVIYQVDKERADQATKIVEEGMRGRVRRAFGG